jgi:hypothetical protein
MERTNPYAARLNAIPKYVFVEAGNNRVAKMDYRSW